MINYEAHRRLQKMLASTITSVMDQINISKSVPSQKDPPKPQEPTTVLMANWRAPPFYNGHSTKIGGM